jgi:hypothetical protein
VKFRHDEFGAPGGAGENIHFVHKCLHQEHAAARIAEDIFIIAGVGHVLEAKARTLVDNMYYQFVFQELKDHMDFSFAPLFVAVLKGVHDAFVDCQADLVLIVLVKSGYGGDTHTQFFSESNALDQCFQNDFEPLRL